MRAGMRRNAARACARNVAPSMRGMRMSEIEHRDAIFALQYLQRLGAAERGKHFIAPAELQTQALEHLGLVVHAQYLVARGVGRARSSIAMARPHPAFVAACRSSASMWMFQAVRHRDTSVRATKFASSRSSSFAGRSAVASTMASATCTAASTLVCACCTRLGVW